jgi:hypothetical protein
MTNYDSVLYVRQGATGNQIGCNDDACGMGTNGSNAAQITNVAINGATLYWLIVDGFSPSSCGNYVLTTNLR